MTDLERVIELHDLDLLLVSLRDDARKALLRRAGILAADVAAIERDRERLAASVDRRWLSLYDRSQRRYGRGLTSVRERVCQGCFMSLPTSASPPTGEAQLHLCESCGRLLYWR